MVGNSTVPASAPHLAQTVGSVSRLICPGSNRAGRVATNCSAHGRHSVRPTTSNESFVGAATWQAEQIVFRTPCPLNRR